ncbi:protein YIPF6 [Plasmodium yoelii yoelii]|uniref:Protein YIPF6 n=1 Tax=Plasmodium yoelii yoelii TaxID=73239 RepID=A0AAE9WRF3_PLAYO|nr:protein YIPF6 [Plasmodium yoelii yoelii]
MTTNTMQYTNYEFTMDEPIQDTLIRDAKSIYKNILQSCFHQYDNDNIVKKCNKKRGKNKEKNKRKNKRKNKEKNKTKK